MEEIKSQLKRHYKKGVIMLVIVTLNGMLVKTPATVAQLYEWVVLSVLIVMIGSEFKSISAFLDEIIDVGKKIREKRKRELHHK